MKLDQSEDKQIATIYERMLNGDKNALNNLQKISNSPFKKSNKQAVKQISNNQETHVQISQDLNKASKSQNFRKYLSQKVNQLKIAQPASKKQIINKQKSSQKKQYEQPKPFSKMRKRNEIKSEQKKGQLTLKKQASPQKKQQKTKTTSHNFQQKINKNIIKDSVTDKDKQSQVPSSNHSFRIRPQGGGKKLLEQLIKLNQEQRRVQLQILQFHKQNKQYISQICQKYSINKLDNSRIKTVENPHDMLLDNIDSPVINKLKGKYQNLNEQQAKISKLMKQIASLDNQIKIKKSQLQKKQAKIQLMPLFNHINSVPDIFEQRQSQQQNQQVSSLPGVNQKNMDPTKTYQSVMGQMKKKKWGLNQRISYGPEGIGSNLAVGLKANESKTEFQRQKSLQKSIKKIQGQQDSKIVVNPRLKQFLFE